MMKAALLAICALPLLGLPELTQDRDAPAPPRSVDDGHGELFLVPAGEFTMGDNYDEGRARERPAHPVYVDSYYIGAFEVTNGEYGRFMDAEGYSKREYWSAGGYGTREEPAHWLDAEFHGGGLEDNGSFPVSGVSWFEASAYCSWLSAETGRVYRLPTEGEWE